MTIVAEGRPRALNRRIERAIGSVEMPMTDKQLETKFTDLADGIIPAASIRRVMDACWKRRDAAERRRNRQDVGVVVSPPHCAPGGLVLLEAIRNFSWPRIALSLFDFSPRHLFSSASLAPRAGLRVEHH